MNRFRGPRARFLLAFVLGVLLAQVAVVARADVGTTFGAYTLSARGYRVPVPRPYVRDREISGLNTESGGFKDPSSIFVDDQGNLWVADTGHDRIVVFDSRGRFRKTLGKVLNLRQPRGVFVTPNGDIYVADTGNGRILELNARGQPVREFKKPDSPLLRAERYFQPAKVVVDRRGYLYVLEESSDNGIMVIDGEGQFRGYFGATRLQFDLRQLIINVFATQAQKEQILSPQPVPHTDMYLTPDGFLYTAVSTATVDQIQKLNPVGINIFRPDPNTHQFFGETNAVGARLPQPGFTAVTVDQYGVVSAIDLNSSRIYQYDQSRKMLLSFGGLGLGPEQFDHPSSIATDGAGNLYVLDTGRNVVYRLRPTRFTQMIHQASKLYFDGNYTRAADVWRTVLKYDNQYELAHTGLGQALYRQRKYAAALKEFQQAYDRAGYSNAFDEYRYHWLRQYFGELAVALIAVMVGFTTFTGAIGRGVRALGKRLFRSDWPFEFQALIGILRHPEDTLWEFRQRGSLWVVPLLLLATIAVRLLSLWLLAFHMLDNPALNHASDYLSPYNLITYYYLKQVDPDQISVAIEVLHILVPWLAWVIVNYGAGVIFDGEASFRSILTSSVYCLVPYTLFTLPIYAASHLLVRDNLGLFHALISVTYLWSAFLFFLQVKVVHDFDVGKSFRVLVINGFGMVVLVGLVGLLYLISSQLFHFAWEVLYEFRTL